MNDTKCLYDLCIFLIIFLLIKKLNTQVKYIKKIYFNQEK